MTVNFKNISLTARLTAYMRQYSDIPFAKDVANRLRAEEAFEKLLRDNELSPKDLLWYAPLLEVRYKSVAETIRKLRATQVLELASGFSLRGLAVTQDPKLTYVESDLEELTEEKASLVADLRRQYRLADHANLHLVTADALDRSRLRSPPSVFGVINRSRWSMKDCCYTCPRPKWSRWLGTFETYSWNLTVCGSRPIFH